MKAFVRGRLVIFAFIAIVALTFLTRADAAILSCSEAAAVAEAAMTIPPGLLLAIGNVESGRPDAAGTLTPWPWTINSGGIGRFFSTPDEAVSAVQGLRAIGAESIDIGCFQINLLHHPAAFTSLLSGFDPLTNALAAARFLVSLHDELGGWEAAVGAYHSRVEVRGAPYRDLVLATWHGTPRLRSIASVSTSSPEPLFPGIHIWGPAGEIGSRSNGALSASRVTAAGRYPHIVSRLPRVFTISVR